MPRLRTLASALLLVLAAACVRAGEPAGTDRPRAAAADPGASLLPSPRGGTVLLRDAFDGENGGRPVLMHKGFRNWVVRDGTVDLVGAGSDWDFLPGNGLYVDLDGDRPDGVTFDAGRLVSRQAFALEPGTYVLTFRLAGSHRRSDENTVRVRLGAVHDESITLPAWAPFGTYVRGIPVHAPAEAVLSFENRGADGFGLLLDDVELRRL